MEANSKYFNDGPRGERDYEDSALRDDRRAEREREIATRKAREAAAQVLHTKRRAEYGKEIIAEAARRGRKLLKSEEDAIWRTIECTVR